MDKFQKRVIKQYPNAYPEYSSSGIRIINADVFIAKEFYVPITHNEDMAWEYAALACKMTQNFNRAHPLRMDLVDVETKLARIDRRKKKGRRVK
tara:strand:- start:122 stop:403 length:282 start_codon:yes stop_codon:yes gene_type:complete